MIALQVRGGPEPYMISSWIQILRVRSTDAGIFSCTVVSKKGIVRAEGTVTVAKVINQLSTQTYDYLVSQFSFFFHSESYIGPTVWKCQRYSISLYIFF